MAGTNDPWIEADRHPGLALVLLVILSLLGNIAGAILRYPGIGTAVLFPPYAVLTAALVTGRRRHWGWYTLAAVAAHVSTSWPHWSLSWVLMADLANVLRAFTAAVLLRWLIGEKPRLDGIGGLLAFVVAAVLVAPAVGATIGAANVLAHGAGVDYWSAWRAWFMSNALTGLTMLPACLWLFSHVRQGRLPTPARGRLSEAVLLVLALAGTCAFAFAPPVGGSWHSALAFYAPLPVLIWAALRFGSAGASLASTVVVFAAIWSADRGAGPFFASSPDEAVLTLQSFALLTAFPVLGMAALDDARQSTVGLYRSLLASQKDQVAILDARGVVMDVNDSWRRSTDAATEHSWHSVGQGDDWLAACRVAAEHGDVAADRAKTGLASVLHGEKRLFEMEYDRDAGQEAYLLRVEALERSDGGVVVTRSDTTARRRAAMEMEEQRRELWHLARVAVLGQLTGALAHELNQPLTAIMSNADAARSLLARPPVDVDELREILADIAADDRRAAQVIQRLRALLQRGDTRRQPLNAGEVAAEALELSRSELTERGVTATLTVDPDLPVVLGDRVQLQQVLLNLILNACEAMSDTCLSERAMWLSAHRENGDAHLAVRDRGPGIEPDLVERLFEPFVTTKAEGLGLGLSISRTIVDAHGGRLWAENNPDGGATLHCRLPSAEAPRRAPVTVEPAERA